MVTVFKPTESLKSPSAVLLFKTSFFPYPGAPSSHSGLVCSFSCGFVGARTSSRSLASGDLSGSARGNVSALTQHCSSPYTGGMKGIGGAERRFIIEAEGVKGRSSVAPPCRVFTRCVLILRLRNE